MIDKLWNLIKLVGNYRKILAIIAAISVVSGVLWHYQHVLADRRELQAALEQAESVADANFRKHNLIVGGMREQAEQERTLYEAEAHILEQAAHEEPDNSRVSPYTRSILAGLREYEAKHVHHSR